MGLNSKAVLVLISADVEWAAVKQILQPSKLSHSPFGEFFIYRAPGSNYPQEVIFFKADGVKSLRQVRLNLGLIGFDRFSCLISVPVEGLQEELSVTRLY